MVKELLRLILFAVACCKCLGIIAVCACLSLYGFDSNKKFSCVPEQGPVARVVDITAATLFGCTVVGVLYVVAAGPKGGGSVCYPGTKAFPPEISALLVVAPFLVMGAAGCVYSLNWVLGIRPLCAIRTKNLLHALLAATLAAWLAGCVGNASAGPMAAGMGLFLTAACIVWAWDGGYLQVIFWCTRT